MTPHEIAKDFISHHDDAALDCWQPVGLFGESKLLAIYHNLIEGLYGNVTEEDGTFSVEIGSQDSKTGNPYIFEWVADA